MNMRRSLVLFCACLVVITIIFGTMYGVVQQSLRTGADAAQLEIAQNTRAALEQGTAPADAIPKTTVQMASSLSPFVIIYTAQTHIAASNARLGDTTPELPAGVLQHATAQKEHRLTWQPRGDVRIAAVVVRTTNGYYVLAGRNLREVESRENRTLLLAVLGWVASIGVLSSAYLLTQASPGTFSKFKLSKK